MRTSASKPISALRATAALLWLVASACPTVDAAQIPFALSPSEPSTSSSSSATPKVSSPADFSGHSVVRFTTRSRAQFASILDYADQHRLDVWSARRGVPCPSPQEHATPLAALHDPQWNPQLGCIDLRLVTAPAGNQLDALMQSLALQPQHEYKQFSPLAVPQIMIPDVQQLIDEQKAQRTSRTMAQSQAYDETWHDDYHSYQEIDDFLSHLEVTYPAYAKKVDIGTTHEGRTIWVLKVGHGQNNTDSPTPRPTLPGDGDDDDDDGGDDDDDDDEDDKGDGDKAGEDEEDGDGDSHKHAGAERKRKRKQKHKGSKKHRKPGKISIVIAAEQHAREWISTSTSLFFASELLRSALSDPAPNNDDRSSPIALPWTRKQALKILSRFEISFVPLVNPDGYVYSWDENRMWRKNRQPNDGEEGGDGECSGIDLNSNWGVEFQPGAYPCSESFAGRQAFEARETNALATYIAGLDNVEAVVDLHSYGQLLTYPYSYTCSTSPGDEEDLLELSLGAVRKLRSVHSRTFTVGKTCDIVGEAAGNLLDWSYASSSSAPPGSNEEGEKLPRLAHKVKYTFAMQLRDGGTYGFLLPSAQIRPTGEETGAALVYLLGFVWEREGDKQKSGRGR
ncbi:hypothetical protein ACQY0O_002336 [Thecaphora frezii]